jgi:hypothetical protein
MNAPTLVACRSFLSRLGDLSLELVAPRDQRLPAVFSRIRPSADQYESMIEQIQQIRGAVCLEDGTIPASAPDARGRHYAPIDETSWHLIVLNQREKLVGCLRVTVYRSGIRLADLKLHEVITRMEIGDQGRYEPAIDAYLADAKSTGLQFAEAGGWAVAKEFRNSSVGSVLCLATVALGQVLGNTLNIASANGGNGAAKMIRRLAGAEHLSRYGVSLTEFFETHDGVPIEILIWDSRQPPQQYARDVREINLALRNAPVLVSSWEPEVYALSPAWNESA